MTQRSKRCIAGTLAAWLGVALVLPPRSGLSQEIRSTTEQTTITSATSRKNAALGAGEELYEKQEYTAAATQLQAALRAEPDNSEALLFAGLAHLRLDDPGSALADWQRFVAVSKDPRAAAEVGRLTTIVLRAAAEKAVKEAIARERQLAGLATDRRTVAVAPFRNAGSEEYAFLGKALAAMLIDNLSALPGIGVLERDNVEALIEEAKLGAAGLVDKATAVRAGKLLRAGRVTAGSHADWSGSPTHIKLDAVLVDVDEGREIASAKSQTLASEFYTLIPEVARVFAGALGQPVTQLGPAVASQVENQHTRSLPAVLAFGRALDGLDRKDMKAALAACKEVQRADPNFELAKRKCALIPPFWTSLDGVIRAAEPTAFELAGLGAGSGTSPYLVPAIIGGAVVVGAVAGGIALAGGGGGGKGSATNRAPELRGVSDRTVNAGETAVIDMTCSDPEGARATIANPNPPPGSSFAQQSGNPATGRFQMATNFAEAGQTFRATFVCTDSNSPPASTTQSANIHVVLVGAPTPTPGSPATPTPVVCGGLSTSCTADSQCCSNHCSVSSDPQFGSLCCLANDTGGCSNASDCCLGDCVSGTCICRPAQSNCAVERDCCSLVCNAGSCG